MPVDYDIQTTGDSGTGIPAIETTVQYLLESGYKFVCRYNKQADSFTIKFLKPVTDFRVTQLIRTKGWDCSPTSMTLRNLTQYRPKYHSPLYLHQDGRLDYLVNTGSDMTPDPGMVTPLTCLGDRNID